MTPWSRADGPATEEHRRAAGRRPPSLSAVWTLSAATLLGAAAPVAAVLLLLREGPSGHSRACLGYLLTACCVVWWSARTVGGLAVPRAARAVDHEARRSVLTTIDRLADSGRLDPGDRVLRDAVHAAAGVAIRWEPKPGTAIAPAARLLHTALVLCGTCLALASAHPPAGWLCVGGVVLGGVARSWRPAPAGAVFGRAQWLALAGRTRRRPLTARVSALALGLTAFLTAGTRPGLEAGAALAAVLLYRTAATPQDTTALRHGVTALRQVRRLVATAGRTPGDRTPGARMTVRTLPDGGVRIRLAQPGTSGTPGRDHVTEVRMAPGRHVRLTTARDSTDVLRHLMVAGGGQAPGDTVPVLLVPPDPLRLGFASLADNVTLGGAPEDRAQPPSDDVTKLAAGLSRGRRTVLSAQYARGEELDESGWAVVTAARVAARLPAGPVLVCLAADPDPALARVLERARNTGACVLQLEPAPLTVAASETA
ncbi:hypothetical protein [Streptomyces sp. NPDC057623]|uniref:hypothetical protein n=1 Tax=Streptomyces sp. NPDC057623 TaxID=3346187 RepID=UPI00367E824F